MKTLDALQKIFSLQPFLLGSRPTRADFGLMAPLFRHFSSDPTPRKIMQQRAPAVLEWVARMWNCRSSTLPQSTLKPIGSLPMGWEDLGPLLREYLAYLDCNARAWRRGDSQFTATFQGVESQVRMGRRFQDYYSCIGFVSRSRPCPTECGVGLSSREGWRR